MEHISDADSNSVGNKAFYNLSKFINLFGDGMETTSLRNVYTGRSGPTKLSVWVQLFGHFSKLWGM
jgi:hypothetical protein